MVIEAFGMKDFWAFSLQNLLPCQSPLSFFIFHSCSVPPSIGAPNCFSYSPFFFFFFLRVEMDDATTAFATACAVLAASTDVLFCFSTKDPSAYIVEEDHPEEEAAAVPENGKEPEECSTDAAPVMVAETPAVVAEDVVPPVVEDMSAGIPEQRPTESPPEEKKKRRLSMRWGTRRVETDAAVIKKTRSFMWRPKAKGTAQEV